MRAPLLWLWPLVMLLLLLLRRIMVKIHFIMGSCDDEQISQGSRSDCCYYQKVPRKRNREQGQVQGHSKRRYVDRNWTIDHKEAFKWRE